VNFQVAKFSFKVTEKDIERFWSKVDMSGECWTWKASRHPQGYGNFSLNGRIVRAHRFSFWLSGRELINRLRFQTGTIYDIHHECENTSCVRPSHLTQTSRFDHKGTIADLRRSQTHCHRGHPLSGGNMRIESYGARRCRECHNIANRKHRSKNGTSSQSQAQTSQHSTA
jgi:hypothetical protein